MKINWAALFAWAWCLGFWACIALTGFGVISYWWIVIEFSVGILGVCAAVIRESMLEKAEITKQSV